MRRIERHRRATHCLAVGTAALFGLGAITSWAQPPTPIPAGIESFDEDSSRSEMQASNTSDEEGVDYLTRGPLHEAFADPYARDPKPNPIISEQPPEPIDELPPEYRPTGDNVRWIPGYWAWDDEREDFLWISGVWRDIPPNRRWVAGYWDEASNGFRWVDGFWTESNAREVAYLPAPPESVEEGPSAPAPSENHFYVPGHWTYQANDYQWQPGYWAKAQPNWVWVPSQYYWTPRGCVYRNGYWDYDLPDRGIVFTPVYYRQRTYTQPNYVYRPRYALDTTSALLVNLFLRSNTNRYYFGDYYGNNYANSYYPWINYSQRRNSYDPLYAYYSARGVGQNSRTLDWINRRYDYFSKNDGYRPPRTVADQRRFLQTNAQNTDGLDSGILRVAAIAESMNSLVNDERSGLNLQRVNESELDNFRRDIRETTNDLINRRREFEVDSRSETDVDAETDNSAASANANVDTNARLQLPEVLRNANDETNLRSRSNQRARSNERDGNPIERLERQSREATDDAIGELRERVNGGQGQTRNARERLEGARDNQSPRATDNLPANGSPTNGVPDGLNQELNRQQDQMRDRLQQLRQEGRARPQRPDDWPTRQPRTNRGGGIPEIPTRGNRDAGRGTPSQGGGVPEIGDALNRAGANLPGTPRTPNARGGVRGGGNSGGANLGGKNLGEAIGGALGGN